MAREPELVASGSFRVDRETALRKLGAYQAADPWTCLAELVRCADRCGASRIELDQVRGRALRVRFDGASFSPARLADPFKALLQPDASDAGTHLAVGLLAALRVCAHAAVTSGEPPRRWKSRVESWDRTRLSRAEGTGTSIDLIGVRPPSGWRESLRSACRMTRAAVTIEGSPPPARIGAGMYGLDFSSRFRWGRIEVPVGPARESRIEVYTRGVLAEIVTRAPVHAPVRAWVNDDGLSLDASRQKIARNRRFLSLLAALEREEQRLIQTAAATEEARCRALFAEMPPPPEAQAARWEAWLRLAHAPDRFWGWEGTESVLHLGIGRLLQERQRAKEEQPPDLREAARLTAWLWDAAELSLGGPSGLRGLSGAKRALWDAPIFLAGDSSDPAARLSLAAAAQRGRVVATMRHSPRQTSGLMSEPVLLITGERDQRALRAIFRGRLRDRTAAWEQRFRRWLRRSPRRPPGSTAA